MTTRLSVIPSCWPAIALAKKTKTTTATAIINVRSRKRGRCMAGVRPGRSDDGTSPLHRIVRRRSGSHVIRACNRVGAIRTTAIVALMQQTGATEFADTPGRGLGAGDAVAEHR